MPLREFESVKVGDQLPEKVIPLTRGDLVNYAGVSGDLNPIHWDDDIAKQVGLDTAIAHGMRWPNASTIRVCTSKAGLSSASSSARSRTATASVQLSL